MPPGAEFPPFLTYLSSANKCMFKSSQENCSQNGLANDENVPATYCPRAWDRVMCWPPTAPGSQSIQPCFKEFNGLLYDSSREYFV